MTVNFDSEYFWITNSPADSFPFDSAVVLRSPSPALEERGSEPMSRCDEAVTRVFDEALNARLIEESPFLPVSPNGEYQCSVAFGPTLFFSPEGLDRTEFREPVLRAVFVSPENAAYLIMKKHDEKAQAHHQKVLSLRRSILSTPPIRPPSPLRIVFTISGGFQQ